MTSGCSSFRWKEASKHNCISNDSPFHLPKSSLPQSSRLKPASQNVCPLMTHYFPHHHCVRPQHHLWQVPSSHIPRSTLPCLFLRPPTHTPSLSSVASTPSWSPYSSFRVHLQKQKPLKLVWAGLGFTWLTYCGKIWRRHLKQNFQE